MQSVRHAKETLLGDNAPEEVIVSLQKRGSRLIGGTQSIPLSKAEVNELLVDGFIPKTGPGDVPEKRSARASPPWDSLTQPTPPSLATSAHSYDATLRAPKEVGATH